MEAHPAIVRFCSSHQADTAQDRIGAWPRVGPCPIYPKPRLFRQWALVQRAMTA